MLTHIILHRQEDIYFVLPKVDYVLITSLFWLLCIRRELSVAGPVDGKMNSSIYFEVIYGITSFGSSLRRN